MLFRIMPIFHVLLFATITLHSSDLVRIGDVSFRLGMSQDEALRIARQSLAVIPASGVPRFFLFVKGPDGKASGSALGGLGFNNSSLSVIRRDIGVLESADALNWGRKIAASITDSGYKGSSTSTISQQYREFSTASTNTILIRLPDRNIKIVVYESSSPGTASSLEAAEYFGNTEF